MSVQVMIARQPEQQRVAVFQSQHDADLWRAELEAQGYVVTQHTRQVQ